MNFGTTFIISLNIIFASAGPITITADTSENSPRQTDPYRLPTNVAPRHYDLLIVLPEGFGEAATYSGNVSIEFLTLDVVNNVTLHARDLFIDHDSITLLCNEVNVFASFAHDPTYEMIHVDTGNVAIANGTSCVLRLGFTGTLNDDMSGLYRSYYYDENDVLIWIATTQFQATDARRAFPCFDEPALKATFNISVAHPADYHALSNTPNDGPSEQYLNTSLVLEKFQTTPLVSTYLLAIVVSPFVYMENVEHNYRVFARRQANDTLQFSYEIGPKLLQSLNNFTDYDYFSTGIGKLDQVAIPDFSAGAMENWGLVTYREVLLLWDPRQSTVLNKQNIATVISHEFGHMWFGNLVTCEWWSYLWLNEGFARYFEFYTTADVEPSWGLAQQFVVRQVHSAFAADSLASSAPLNSEVSSPAQILNKFTTISYNKGASILRMLEHVMGHENFRDGLREYLKTHEFATAVPHDLWVALTPFATNLPEGRTLEQVMSTWTDEPGYPVLEVSMQGANAVITQRRFFFNSSETSTTRWDVPITYATSHEVGRFQNTTPTSWLSATANNTVISNILHGGTGWIVLNVQETGFYRVTYDNSLWDEIERALKSENFGSIGVLNRAQIVDDLMNFARAGQIPYTRALDIISYLENEVEYLPWFSAFNEFTFLTRRIGQNEQLEPYLNSFLDGLISNVVETVPFDTIDDDNHIYSLKKILVLTWACQLHHGTCVEKSIRVFRDFQQNGLSVNANLKQVVYCTALRHADTADWWNFLWSTYTQTKLASEQAIILTALGCTRNTSLLNEYLHKSITADSGIRSQDANAVFQAVYNGNPEGVDFAFGFLKENYQEIANFYGSLGGLSGLITGMADRFTREEQVTEMEAFLHEHSEHLGQAALVVQSAIETAKGNIQWTQSFSEELRRWFTRGSAVGVSISFSLVILVIVLNVGIM